MKVVESKKYNVLYILNQTSLIFMKHLVLILWWPFLSFAQIEIKPSVLPYFKEDWKTFSEKNYSISYPDSWSLQENTAYNAKFAIMSPLESESDNFSENVSLMLQNLEEMEVDLQKFTELTLGQIKSMLTNGVLYANETVSGRNGKYQKMIYAFDQETNRVKVLQYLWVANKKAYILTFAATSETYTAYENLAKEIMNTFHIK